MANKVNIELSCQTTGFVQGMNQATDSVKAYETETRKIQNSTINFNKALRDAKREVKDLAAGYAALSNEAKNSDFGKEMKRQLDEAKKKAAEYIDMQQDLNTELKNMASDTRYFDTARDAISVLGNVASSAVGSFALLTGSEESARKAVVAFTTAQSAMNGVISIGNALQKQSNIMIAVSNVQKWAAAKAAQAETTATIGATAAQKAFNIVASMNPYALLATAIIAVTAAIGAFIIATNKAEDAQKKLRKEIHETSLQGQRDAQADITKLNVLYAASQNVNLSMEDRMKAVDALQRQYPGYFGDIEKEKILVGEAADAYRQLTNDILATAMARAYEKKIQTLAEERVELEDQLELQKKITESAEKMRHSWENTAPAFGAGAGQINMTVVGANKNEQVYDAEKKKLEELNKKIEDNTAATQKWLDKSQETIAAQNRLAEGTAKVTTPTVKHGGSGNANTVREIQAVTGSIAELEKQISDAQNAAKKGILPDELKDPEKYKAYIGALQKQLKELKITWGFEKPETKLQELQAKLEAARQKYVIAVEVNDAQAMQEAKEAFFAAQDELEKYKLSIEIPVELAPGSSKALDKQIKELKEKLENIKIGSEEWFNISDQIKELEKQKGSAETNRNIELTLSGNFDKSINGYKEAISTLETAMDDIDFEAMGLQGVAMWAMMQEALERYQETLKGMEKEQENQLMKPGEKVAKTFNKIGDVADMVGGSFKAMGDASEDAGMRSVGILSEALATLALSFAKALASTSTWVEWLAFGITGLSTFMTLGNAMKDAGRYAEGGIVGGHSYTGDKLLAYVNSQELILNKRQQETLLSGLESTSYVNGNTTVQVEGVIRGTDLLLVQKNTNKALSRAGNAITF